MSQLFINQRFEELTCSEFAERAFRRTLVINATWWQMMG